MAPNFLSLPLSRNWAWEPASNWATTVGHWRNSIFFRRQTRD